MTSIKISKDKFFIDYDKSCNKEYCFTLGVNQEGKNYGFINVRMTPQELKSLAESLLEAANGIEDAQHKNGLYIYFSHYCEALNYSISQNKILYQSDELLNGLPHPFKCHKYEGRSDKETKIFKYIIKRFPKETWTDNNIAETFDFGTLSSTYEDQKKIQIYYKESLNYVGSVKL